MTPRTSEPVPRLSPLRRLGPMVAILVAVALVAVLASTGRDEQAVTATGGGSSGRGAERAPDLPVTYAEAKKAGTLSSYDFGANCDPRTGLVRVPSVYAPPCVAAPKGLKGGATYQGVTDSTITVVLYQPADQDLAAQLQAKLDPQSKVEKSELAYIDMFEHTYNTWGRKLDIKRLKGSGVDETSARADAVKVADEYHAFASLNGPSQAPAYADELASRGVLCMNCGLGVPDSTYQKNAPFMWGPLQTPEQFLLNVGDYLIDRLNHRKAIHAGDPAFRNRQRTFGVVHFEQDPPVFGPLTEQVIKEGKSRGYRTKINLSYTLVLDKLAEEARTLIAKLKEEKVTTVVFLGDPIMPINLTKAATEQDYFPEWVITGTVLTDTTTLGRLYDQKQWANTFGVSSLAVPINRANYESWRLHRWYFGTDPEATKTNQLIYATISQFMLGVHMAGPKLTPQTFRGGMFKYPISGGGRTNQQVSYGNHGFFRGPDYLAVDDMAEIWWDPKGKGPDEQEVQGTGVMRFANGGRRYLPGQMPKTPDDAFKMRGSVVRFKAPPPNERPPNYPSPRPPGG